MESKVHRITKMVRCSGVTKNGFKCNKMLTKLIFMFAVPLTWEESGHSISSLFKGLDLKLATETKCPNCKSMSYALTAL